MVLSILYQLVRVISARSPPRLTAPHKCVNRLAHEGGESATLSSS